MDEVSSQEAEIKLKDFQEWIKSQPEFPQHIGKIAGHTISESCTKA